MIQTNYSISQLDSQNYRTQPKDFAKSCPNDLFSQSNVLDIGDISEFEHVDLSSDNKNQPSILDTVKNIFGGLFSK